MTVRIVTDSAADIPPQLASDKNVTVVPLTVRFGDDSYRSGVDLSADEFWQKLKTSTEAPATAAPSAGDFQTAFEDLIAKGATGIVSVHLSSKLSATYQSAVVAAQEISAVAGRGRRHARRLGRNGPARAGLLPNEPRPARPPPTSPRSPDRLRSDQALRRDRHPRVPPARRAHRRCASTARVDAQGEAGDQSRRRDRRAGDTCPDTHEVARAHRAARRRSEGATSNGWSCSPATRRTSISSSRCSSRRSRSRRATYGSSARSSGRTADRGSSGWRS